LQSDAASPLLIPKWILFGWAYANSHENKNSTHFSNIMLEVALVVICSYTKLTAGRAQMAAVGEVTLTARSNPSS